MKKKTGYSLVDDYATLSRQLAKGNPQPSPRPSGLTLEDIKLWPKVFQHRGFAGPASKAHVLKLTASIKKNRNKTLDPITVWWDGKGWACVDGHHRHQAYGAAKLGSGHIIPVEAFEGALGQAMAKAAQANTSNKLDMTSAEKSDAAWHLVTMTLLTKEETAAAARVSESTVASMRRVFNQLKERTNTAGDSLSVTPGGDCADLSWANAKRLAEGREAPDFDREVANEKKAQAMALELRKAMGTEGGKYPEILARALELYDPRLPEVLADWWSTQDGATGVEEF